ncbi:MAG: ATP-binding protein [Desulfobacteraceae bacterium]|jgi:signal transduction histidine kinase
MNTVKIVFADDDIVARKLVLKLLSDLDFNIIIAENGIEAWKLIKASGARILVTDWEMPGISGLDLCRKIRKEFVDSYIYIILVTSRGEKEDTIEGLKAGADDFLIKPLNVGELRARIRTGLRIVKLEDQYKKANAQLLQSEKMASVGQLAAGVAHEINNPTGFVSSNLKTLSGYQKDINDLIAMYKDLLVLLKRPTENDKPNVIEQAVRAIEEYEKEIDLEFLVKDTQDLMSESSDGLERIKKIVMDLKDFAHPGEETMQEADINACLDSTLNVIQNEIKYKAVVKKEYGVLPPLVCYPQQLNQVFMNMIINSVQAMTQSMGEIVINTAHIPSGIRIRIKDNGCGIEKKNQSRIFDPFFTTKEVGKGTGLGMNVTYNIIKKHNGTIDLWSEVGKGTEFTITFPLSQADVADNNS